jgi:hypothetical protein
MAGLVSWSLSVRVTLRGLRVRVVAFPSGARRFWGIDLGKRLNCKAGRAQGEKLGLEMPLRLCTLGLPLPTWLV